MSSPRRKGSKIFSFQCWSLNLEYTTERLTSVSSDPVMGLNPAQSIIPYLRSIMAFLSAANNPSVRVKFQHSTAHSPLWMQEKRPHSDLLLLLLDRCPNRTTGVSR
ncbi:hypothetical protein CDAR_559231 [Caerostris darwini]|uniref:Uncharacterized protein n=1 Tax=Caerostris darwini TaxID=1538125 RepID=A0AAV4P2F3_9ARAC|nr:hypothetical protein CDAR_559231 [Caerostris darwini]